MMVVVALPLAGVLLGGLSACALTRGTWQMWHPHRALLLWAALGAVGLVCAAVSVVVAAVVSTSTLPGSSAAEALVVTLVAWAGLGGFGVVASLALQDGGDDPDAAAEDSLLGPRRVPDLRAARRIVAWLPGDIPVVEVDDPSFIAYAVAGVQPEILVSQRAREQLSPAHLDGIIAHERAHLTGRHPLLRRLGRWHAACLPKRSRLRRELFSRTRLLTELAADDTAVTEAGEHHVLAGLHAANALWPSAELTVRAARLNAHGESGGPGPSPAARTGWTRSRPGRARSASV